MVYTYENGYFCPKKNGKIPTRFPLVGFLLVARRWMMPYFYGGSVVLVFMVFAILLREMWNIVLYTQFYCFGAK